VDAVPKAWLASSIAGPLSGIVIADRLHYLELWRHGALIRPQPITAGLPRVAA
jgi:hypothetical protein